MKNTSLPKELEAAREQIEAHAHQYGLDFFPIIYEVLDYRTLYETASMGGFPIRYPHWRFGMEYDQLMKGHVWMGSTIYEMVINTNPSYSYLLEGNETVTQKMVMAHVTAHVDFFKHNMWFAHTNRKMLDEMANHASRIQLLIDRYGYEVVEDFIDTCLSLENLIDYHSPYIKRPDTRTDQPIIDDDTPPMVEGLKVERDYMRHYINPPEFLEAERRKVDEERQRYRRFPENPQRDILLFLLNYAPLERWQHTVLEIIRDEAYYFAPQGMTKILNEGWACLVAGSLVYTNCGLLPIETVIAHSPEIQVSDGTALQHVYDHANFTERETVYLRTRRGFCLEGSTTHRVLRPDGSWRRLDALQPGDQLQLAAGPDLWAQNYVTLAGEATSESVLADPLLVHEHMDEPLCTLATVQPGAATGPSIVPTFPPTSRPLVLDETAGAFLGCIVSNGYINDITHTIALIASDKEQVDQFAVLVHTLFGLPVTRRFDANCWRASVMSPEAVAWLLALGLKSMTTHDQQLPDSLLRSPKSVVMAFLQALYDGAGTVEPTGVTLTTPSEVVGQIVQLLLLNVGILSTRREQANGYWHIALTSHSVSRFAAEIGFRLARPQRALQHWLATHPWPQPEDWQDDIVELTCRRAAVYDISVTETHRYAAQGFINHNSYWHSEIMTRKMVQDSEIISFADLHSGVVATGSGRLNPYKLGIELLRHIEERWDKGRFGKAYDECDDLYEKQNWDQQLGLGRQKIFEIRKLYNDVTFIDEFLTPEFVLEQQLFSFKYNRDTDMYEIASRQFQEVKEKLLFRLTNFGQPRIVLEDANFNNRSELYLRHQHEGIDLQMDYARDTMRNLHKIWTRPIYLETVIDEKRRLLCFDGVDFSERRIDMGGGI